MRFFHRAMEFETESFARPAAQALLLVAMAVAACGARAPGARAQDGGRPNDALFNRGAEIVVTVHDVSGEAISSTVMVAIYKDGARPAGQTVTSLGSATFVVTSLGEFSVVVEAAGYRRAVKEVSVPEPQRTSVDVYLQREAAAATTVGVPGRPVLAPKAKEALEQGLLALGADKMGNAEKYVSEAVRLAPGHPDVLYVQGVLYLKQRKFGRAQTALESATQIDPTHARAFAALGMALSDQAKYPAAIVSLEKSLQIDPAVGWDARWALAKAYYQQGRYEEALKLSQAAAELAKGKQPQIALLVAQSLTATGKYEEAAVTLRGFVKEHGERDEAITARRWLQKLETSGKIASPRQEAMKQ